MSLTKQQKKETVKDAQKSVSEATSVVFMSYDALNMDDNNELRENLHKNGCSMRVIPKRLLHIALDKEKLDFDPTEHEGQMALVWGEDAVAPAKVLHDFAKDRENISLRAGVLEGNLIEAEQVISLAKLPSKEQLLGQLVSVLNGPARGFASVLAAVPKSAVHVLQAIKEQKEKA